MKETREADALRAALARLERRGRGRPYPTELRERLAAFVKVRRAQGVSARAVGDELGISWRTLLRWSQGEPAAGFERVVVRDEEEDEHERESAARLVVHGPSGLRIEGLDVEGLAKLLRSLA